ncbi:CIC11C00000005586 [Sungouiella intermedia]|uniref:CIC11C00000005586 n=1 Tax=Sungouiella intermedia TaxID=45354 RepID=A0A1L0DAN2_9ASCO|nr:CIC11C00000005586 [[Candida] intermedia]
MLQFIRYSSRLNRKPMLSLEEFMFRLRVLHTYRRLMRIIYKHHEKQDLLKFAKDEFRINREETELNHRKYLLQLGLTRINDMAKVFGINAKF